MRRLLLLVIAGCATPQGDAPQDTDVDTEPTDTEDSDAPDDTEESDDTDETSDTDPVGTGATLLQGAPVACADPTVRTRQAYDRVTTSIRAPSFPYLAGGGMAVGDFDGDGGHEIVAVAHNAIYYGHATRGGIQGEIILEAPAHPDPTAGYFGALSWDADEDGDLDLLISGLLVPSVFLRNNGTGTFTEATAEAGFTFPAEHYSASASASDWDGDGDLDVAVAGYGKVIEGGTTLEFPPGDSTLMFRNTGGGVYEPVPDLLPAEAHPGFSFVPAWLDADGDGDDDLYLLNDFGRTLEPNRLIWNEGGSFRMDDGATGLDVRISAMGIGLGDYDGDGLEDMVLSDWGGLVALKHLGNAWFDITSNVGVDTRAPQTVAWGNDAGDMDNDGDLDILAAFGFVETTHGAGNGLRQPDAVFEQLANGTFRDRAPTLRLDDDAPHRGIGVVDINRDGWLDVYRVGLDGLARVDLANCSDESWVRIDLRQPAPNVHAIGATVRVISDGQVWLRRMRAGGTALGTGLPPEVHVGLGTRNAVDVEVTWPDGQTDRFRDVPTQRPLRIERP